MSDNAIAVIVFVVVVGGFFLLMGFLAWLDARSAARRAACELVLERCLSCSSDRVTREDFHVSVLCRDCGAIHQREVPCGPWRVVARVPDYPRPLQGSGEG